MHYLIVDDHPIVADGMKTTIQGLDANAQVDIAYSGADALESLLRADPFDIALVDLNLPDLHGTEVIKLLCAHSPRTRVVAIAGNATSQSVSSSLSAGACGFIPKSANAQTVKHAMKTVLSGERYVPPDTSVLRPVPIQVGLPDIILPGPDDEALDQLEGAAMPNPIQLGLTSRQCEVLAKLMQGKSNKQISRELKVAEGTIKIHVVGILKHLSAESRTHAVVLAQRWGWTPDWLLRFA